MAQALWITWGWGDLCVPSHFLLHYRGPQDQRSLVLRGGGRDGSQDPCFWSLQGAAGPAGWHRGSQPAQPAGGGAWPCFPTGAAGMSSGHGGGKQAARGWFPDGRSGLPAVDSMAPPVSAAPSGVIQLRLARSGMPVMPKLPCHQCAPHSLCTGHNAFPLSFVSTPSTCFPEVERFRVRNGADGEAPSSRALQQLDKVLSSSPATWGSQAETLRVTLIARSV